MTGEQQDFSDFFYKSDDGLRLHARLYGGAADGRLPAVVCLPGLTRNARDFHELAVHLSTDHTTPRLAIVFDYRGRGLSDYSPHPATYSVAVEARDIVTGLNELGVEQAQFIGTSRGGLIMHVLAESNPGLMSAAVFNDVGPALEVEGLRQIRGYLDGSRTPQTFEEAVDIQRGIHSAAFPALLQEDWERFVRAIYRDESGIPVLDYDPKLVEPFKTMTLEGPLPTLWEQFDLMRNIPMMVIRGENSRLLSVETVEEMERRYPGLVAITVAGQGHAPLLETGDLPEIIGQFLKDAAKQ
ncbi:alpha/beta hydrolase [Corticibacterium sp. UT-5YL-CI-8]|nr:alpha/beta hydrolase [Tianweitania sp. UT-5YL-CI-8]